MSSETFQHALSQLVADCGRTLARAGSQLRTTSGNLEIVVTPGAEITVSLGGWHHRFAGSDEEDDDAALLALDLIGAALVGAVRVVAESYAGQPRRFTLQLLRGADWQTVTTQGSRPWSPFAARTTHVHVGDAPRPAHHAPAEVTALPWAPWAGACGFYGAPATGNPAALPVDGELDLHNFRPREIKPLVLAYLDECLARGITELRIVHGKGIGNLRRTVHALLDRHPRVKGYRLGGHGGGGWGATIVDLSPEPGKVRTQGRTDG